MSTAGRRGSTYGPLHRLPEEVQTLLGARVLDQVPEGPLRESVEGYLAMPESQRGPNSMARSILVKAIKRERARASRPYRPHDAYLDTHPRAKGGEAKIEAGAEQHATTDAESSDEPPTSASTWPELSSPHMGANAPEPRTRRTWTVPKPVGESIARAAAEKRERSPSEPTDGLSAPAIEPVSTEAADTPANAGADASTAEAESTEPKLLAAPTDIAPARSTTRDPVEASSPPTAPPEVDVGEAKHDSPQAPPHRSRARTGRSTEGSTRGLMFEFVEPDESIEIVASAMIDGFGDTADGAEVEETVEAKVHDEPPVDAKGAESAAGMVESAATATHGEPGTTTPLEHAAETSTPEGPATTAPTPDDGTTAVRDATIANDESWRQIIDPYALIHARTDLLAGSDGWRSGFGELDNTGFQFLPGRLYMVHAPSGGGKTALLLEMLRRHVDQRASMPTDHWPALLVSASESRAETYVRLLMHVAHGGDAGHRPNASASGPAVREWVRNGIAPTPDYALWLEASARRLDYSVRQGLLTLADTGRDGVEVDTLISWFDSERTEDAPAPSLVLIDDAHRLGVAKGRRRRSAEAQRLHIVRRLRHLASGGTRGAAFAAPVIFSVPTTSATSVSGAERTFAEELAGEATAILRIDHAPGASSPTITVEKNTGGPRGWMFPVRFYTPWRAEPSRGAVGREPAGPTANA